MNLELRIDQLLAQHKAPRTYAVVCDTCGRVGASGRDKGAVVEAATLHSAQTGHSVRAAKVGGGGKRRHGKWRKRARAAGGSTRDMYTLEAEHGYHVDVTHEPSVGGWVAHLYHDGQWAGSGATQPTAAVAIKEGDKIIAHALFFAKRGQTPARKWGDYEGDRRERSRSGGKLFVPGGKRRRAVTTKYGPRGGRTEIQSLLFPVKLWTEARAKAWAAKNDFRMGDVDVTDNYIRLRQFEPSRFGTMRTKCLAKRKGRCIIKAVVGIRS